MKFYLNKSSGNTLSKSTVPIIISLSGVVCSYKHFKKKMVISLNTQLQQIMTFIQKYTHIQNKFCNLHPPRQLQIVVPPIQIKFREVGHIFRKYSEQRIKKYIMVLCSLKTKCLVFTLSFLQCISVTLS